MSIEAARLDAHLDAREARLDHVRGAGRPADVDQLHSDLRAEIAQLKADCEMLRWFVEHDELTGLANRRLFSALAPAQVRSGPAVVLLLDLNGFKPVNDAYGHEAGDRVLRIIAQRLEKAIDGGLIARLGGDEFAGVLTPERSAGFSATWWTPTITGVLDAISAPMTIAGRRMSVSASVGVAVADGSVPIGDLMHRADMAMYEAKIHGLGYKAWGSENSAAPRLATAPPARTPDAPIRPERSDDVPTIDPYQRDPADITPAGTYQRADRVWVFRHGAWYPGVVESASRRAVMATYRRNGGAGTVVDTMGAECVLERTGADPQLDQMHAIRVRPVA